MACTSHRKHCKIRDSPFTLLSPLLRFLESGGTTPKPLKRVNADLYAIAGLKHLSFTAYLLTWKVPSPEGPSLPICL